MTLQWNTWPESHHGPVIDYLAKCDGDCTAADKEALYFFKLAATGVIDAAANTVSYTFTVSPGEQYRIHSVNTLNLNPTQQADFNKAWKLKAGDLFNPDYITHFIENNTALRSFQNYVASYKAVRDPAAHQVDVTITFVHLSQEAA